MAVLSDFYKKDDSDKIWWADVLEKSDDGSYDAVLNRFIFSFDKKKTFDLFLDYPDKLTKEQKELFDAENPDWKKFFEG